MYKNEAQEKWEQSPLYHVLKFRNVKDEQEEVEEDTIERFIDFLKEKAEVIMYEKEKQAEYKRLMKNIKYLESLLPEFMQNLNGYDISKVKRGELELLEKWKDAVGNERNRYENI